MIIRNSLLLRLKCLGFECETFINGENIHLGQIRPISAQDLEKKTLIKLINDLPHDGSTLMFA